MNTDTASREAPAVVDNKQRLLVMRPKTGCIDE